MHVPVAGRALYLERIDRARAAAASSNDLRGFYLMERTGEPGHFQEFWEFADEPAARRFDEAARAPGPLADAFRNVDRVTGLTRDGSEWQQRL